MIARTILTAGLLATTLAMNPVATASAQTQTADTASAQAYLAGFKHVKKQRRAGHIGRFINRGFRTRHFGHRGFYRGTGFGYYPGHRKHLTHTKNGKNHGIVTDRYGNPIKLFSGGALQSR